MDDLITKLQQLGEDPFGNSENYRLDFGENATIKSNNEGAFLNPLFIYQKWISSPKFALEEIEKEFKRFMFIVFGSRETSIPDDLQPAYKLLDIYEKAIKIIKDYLCIVEI